LCEAPARHRRGVNKSAMQIVSNIHEHFDQFRNHKMDLSQDRLLGFATCDQKTLQTDHRGARLLTLMTRRVSY
jgi:hypothetical protein